MPRARCRRRQLPGPDPGGAGPRAGARYGDPREITLAGGQIFPWCHTTSFIKNFLVSAPAGATADPIGQPCAASGFLPRPAATDPVLGQTVDLSNGVLMTLGT